MGFGLTETLFPHLSHFCAGSIATANSNQSKHLPPYSSPPRCLRLLRTSGIPSWVSDLFLRHQHRTIHNAIVHRCFLKQPEDRTDTNLIIPHSSCLKHSPDTIEDEVDTKALSFSEDGCAVWEDNPVRPAVKPKDHQDGEHEICHELSA